MKSPTLMLSAFLALGLAASGCASRVALLAPPVVALANVVQVRTFDAYARGDRVYVKTVITNVSGQPILIDRDGFSLRLESGELISRGSGMTTQHRPYPLAPGEGRDVYVDFHATHKLTSIHNAAVLVGGVYVGADPEPHVLGEIPLTGTRE